jgi:hypothetical protein
MRSRMQAGQRFIEQQRARIGEQRAADRDSTTECAPPRRKVARRYRHAS